MSTQALEVMQEFVDGLKKDYIERQLICEKQWPPVTVEKLVNLQLVEADKTEGFRAGLPQHGAPDDKVKRTPILHGDLFKVEEGKKPVRKLIVEGNAGIGKTTLCTMLTEEWAKGKILTQFDCVLLLPLRDQLVSSASSLPDLLPLYHPDETVCRSVVLQLKRTRGKGVLIIADGWDELSEEKRLKTSLLYSLLFGRLLPSASVLLTSRPSASAPLHDLPTVDCLVEVVGFNEESVKQYIESEFEKCPEKASSLIEQLENNPLIASVCSVPLSCAIVCNLWHTLEGVLPRTLTELYAKITLNIILRNHRTKFDQSTISLASFDSILEDLQEMFWLVCKFAFECLSRDQIVFLEDEIASFISKIVYYQDKFLCFGLLQSARSLLPVGQGLSFHFVHLTIQEFLAALHLVTLPNEEKLKVWETNLRSVRFAMVWRFMFGLGCQKECSYSRKVVCLDDEFVDHFLKTEYSSSHTPLMFCHCSLESLNNIACLKIAKQINGRFKLGNNSSIAFTPHDCVAVFHVLRHTSHCFDMEIRLSDCGLTDKLLRKLTDILSSACGDLQVAELYLDSNKISDISITDLFSQASASFSSLKCLNLSSNSITNISQLFLSCNRLSYLFLSNNPLGVSGIQSLETAVQAGTLVNLRWLKLSNTLTDDADINGELLAKLSLSIASHCPHLRWLDLSRNNIGVPGASGLGGLFISDMSTLGLVESVTSTNAKTALFGVSPISQSLYSLNFSNAIQHKFVLNLSNANINAEAVLSLNIILLCSKPSLDCELILSNNSLGYDGLLAISRMLRSETCPITELDISNTDLTTPVNTESQYHSTQLPICPAIKNSRLTKLYLSNNNFSDDRALILAECLQVCQSLERLYCWSCSLTSSEIIKIVHHLKSSSHKNLRKWDLYSNSIDDEGVNALIENIPQLFPKLEEVDLMISGEIKERLKKLLKVISIHTYFPVEQFCQVLVSDCIVVNLYVSLIQANKEERESMEEAERRAESERLQAEQRNERVRLAVEEEVRRTTVLTEWERTWSPPQSEEVCLLLLSFIQT